MDRLTEIVEEAGDSDRYADEERIQVTRSGSSQTETVSLKEFLMEGDVTQNPTFREDDRIEVPFLPGYSQEAEEFVTYNKNAVFVTGFVKYPGAFRYFPGYSVSDYIAWPGVFWIREVGARFMYSVPVRGSIPVLKTMPGRGTPFTCLRIFGASCSVTPV